MGNLGYNSAAQKSLRVCYNSLDNYLATLTGAILEPHAEYAAYHGLRDGEYMQLNDSLLQIENEFYSSIRPKRPAQSGETALSALNARGIEYVEIRCIDVSPFCPVGVDAEQIRFLDAFLLHCLTSDSPPCNEPEQDRQAANLEATVNRGRQAGLALQREDGACSLANWAGELMDDIARSAELLDNSHGADDYRAALQTQREKIGGERELPSARVLREMREKGIAYYQFALGYSKRWAEHFSARELPAATEKALIEESEASLQRQAEVEAADSVSFEEYLAAYYAQYQDISRVTE
jgi:glutamate--cysteine ligase